MTCSSAALVPSVACPATMALPFHTAGDSALWLPLLLAVRRNNTASTQSGEAEARRWRQHPVSNKLLMKQLSILLIILQLLMALSIQTTLLRNRKSRVCPPLRRPAPSHSLTRNQCWFLMSPSSLCMQIKFFSGANLQHKILYKMSSQKYCMQVWEFKSSVSRWAVSSSFSF